MGSTQDGKGTVTPVSKDTNANSATNPVDVAVSVGGTTIGTANPVPISGTTAQNSASNPVATRLSADGTNFNDSTHPVHVNAAQVSGTAISVNAGNLDNGVQRVTLCANGVVGECSQSIAAATGTKGLVVLGVDGGAVNRSLPVNVDGSTAGANLVQVGGTDGTNAQLLSMDTAGRPYTNRNWTIAGEDVANNWTDTRNASNYSITYTGTVTVDAADHEVIASTNVANYKEVSIVVANSGVLLTDSIVYASNDGTNWVSLKPVYGTLETTTVTLASGSSGIAFYSDEFPFKYIKYNASCGTSTVLIYALFLRA